MTMKVTHNWGYDVQNYSAPETSLSTDPSNPRDKPSERAQTMIRAYHEAGISVVLDVVYNHIYSTEHVPKYSDLIIITGWRQMVSFQMGQVSEMKTASEHEMYRST